MFISDSFPGRAGNGEPLQGFGGAEMSAGRVATTQVALDDNIVLLIQYRAAKRAGRDTSHTLDADLLIQFDRARFRVTLESVHQARFHAGGIIALQTHHWHPEVFKAAVKRINACLTSHVIDRVSKGTGQLAGATAGT